MTVRVTERDARMLAKCAVCRWLTTQQLKGLYFPHATLNAVQKRLRKLADAGYLRSYQEHPTAESIHAVGPKGKALAEERGVEVMAMNDVPRQAEHLWGVNELRLAVERGPVPVGYFFAYWQLADLGWRHPVIPDAVFAVRLPERRAFVAEYDRGTEALDKLLGKLTRYADGLKGYPFEAVLILTEETRRLDLLSGEMRRNGLSLAVLTATLDKVREAGLWEATFIELPGGMKRKVLERSDENGER
jgi:Replication-relaxation